MDIFEPEKRSYIMSRIKGKGTKPEILVMRHLRRNKFYFQKHYRSKVGVILDIALPRKKKAVFIDGDFWHGRTYDRIKKNRPADDYWVLKIARNMERDKEQEQKLIEAGWTYLRVWEKEIMTKRTQQETLKQIEYFLMAK